MELAGPLGHTLHKSYSTASAHVTPNSLLLHAPDFHNLEIPASLSTASEVRSFSPMLEMHIFRKSWSNMNNYSLKGKKITINELAFHLLSRNFTSSFRIWRLEYVCLLYCMNRF